MRITFVLGGMILTGGHRAVFEISNRLVDKGHEVNLVYPLIPLKIAPEYRLKDILQMGRGALGNLKRGKNPDWFKVKTRLIRVPTLLPKFIRLSKGKIPDADFLIATAWETAYPAAILGRSKGKKFYFVQHYEIWDLWNEVAYWQEVEKNETDTYKLGFAMADVIPRGHLVQKKKELVDNSYKLPLKKISTSAWLKELLETKFSLKVEALIPIGNNFNTFSYNKIHDKKPNQNKIILMSYGGKEWKGVGDGLQALKIVKEKFSGVDIVFYGQQRDQNLPDWVEFHQRVKDDELQKLYMAADIFVFPSWVEGWGSPPMEAMACGAACVTTDVGAVREYAIPGETALVVPPRKPELLAEAILLLLMDDELRKKIALAGYKYIQQFTWEKAVDSFENILNIS